MWRNKNGQYLFCEDNLAQVFRAKGFQALKEQGLKVSAPLPKQWVVDCKPVGRGDKALTYLGKYLYRGVVQEKDILRCENDQLTFRYTDNTGRVQTRTRPGSEFLWLLLQPVLPKGFRRARDYGFLHRNSKPLIQLLHYLFHALVPPPREKPKKPPILCKTCGAIMQIIAVRRIPIPKPHPA